MFCLYNVHVNIAVWVRFIFNIRGFSKENLGFTLLLTTIRSNLVYFGFILLLLQINIIG